MRIENIDLDTALLSPAGEGPVTCSVVDKRDVATQTQYKSQEEEKRVYFIHQAMCKFPVTKTLGVVWIVQEYKFSFSFVLPPEELVLTKRNVLKKTA